MRIKTKKMSELSPSDISQLQRTCKTFGVLKKIIKNKQNGTISLQDQENILFLLNYTEHYTENLKSDWRIISWLLIDFCGEYNENLKGKDSDCSVMIYTKTNYRGIGASRMLLEESVPLLIDKVVRVYPDSGGAGDAAFTYWAERHKINLVKEWPIYYPEKIK